MSKLTLKDALTKLPLIAIIRGVLPAEVVDIGLALKSAGFTIIEVPLNSPNAFESIKILADAMGDLVLIGAGTVLTVEQVECVKQTGAQLIVSPNTNPEVIRKSKKLGMYSLPGFYTPSEAFSAIEAGADGLKMFPAETLGPIGYKAMSAILPDDVSVFPVGGVSVDNMAKYIELGVTGFGIGSSIYQIGMNANEVSEKASLLIEQYHSIIN